MLTLRTPSMGSLGLLSEQMDRLFESFATPAFSAAPSPRFPALNVWEEEASYTVEAELPGFDAQSLDLSVADNRLTIKGQRARTALPEGGRVQRSERWTGSFERTVAFPGPVDAEGVSASFDAGVLTITLPKPAEQRPRRIQVRTAGN